MSVANARAWQRTFSRSPLWVTGVTVALLALGFNRSRPPNPTSSLSTGDERGSRVITTQRGRGRAATTPSEVPPRGWKDILFRIWQNIGKDRVIVVAAGVTFYAVLALFPAIAPSLRSVGCSLIPPPSRRTSTVSRGWCLPEPLRSFAIKLRAWHRREVRP